MQKNSLKIFAFVLSFLLIISCASVVTSSEPVWIDKFTSFTLQSVPRELSGQSTMQRLKIISVKGNHELLVQTELLPEQINMVGFSSSGLVLFQLQWNSTSKIEVETKIDIDGIDAAVLLAYYQLSNWPLDIIATGLNGMEAKVSPNNVEQRQYFRQQELVFSLTKKADVTVLEHYRDKYRIEIKTLETSTVSTN